MFPITIVGLGPGDPGLMTRAVWQVLETASEVHVRTRQHPAVQAFPPGLTVHSFDAVYDRAKDFAAVYQEVADRVVALAGERPVIYAVPGDPAIGEATTWLIRRQAARVGLPVKVMAGVSFLEPTCLALDLDPLERDGLQVLDAMVVAASHAAPFDPSRPALLAQCYSRVLASDVKLTLLHSFPTLHPVTVLRAAGTPTAEIRQARLFELDRGGNFDHLTTLYVPPVAPRASWGRLQEIVAHLRAPDGCPWDRDQTLQTLRGDVMEEVYELLEALDSDDDAELMEELGDTALLIAMLAQIAAEEDRFLWPDVMTRIGDKLIRRHPHVFGDVTVQGTEEVLANWARIKQEERQERNGGLAASPLTGVPAALPALALAGKYQDRLEQANILPDLTGQNALAISLWELVTQARAAGSNAETVLRELCRHVAQQVQELEGTD